MTSYLLWKHWCPLHYKTTNYKHIWSCPCSVTERKRREEVWRSVQYAGNSILLMEGFESAAEPLITGTPYYAPFNMALTARVYLHCTEGPKKKKNKKQKGAYVELLQFHLCFLITSSCKSNLTCFSFLIWSFSQSKRRDLCSSQYICRKHS